MTKDVYYRISWQYSTFTQVQLSFVRTMIRISCYLVYAPKRLSGLAALF